jgi:hypothetical protein
MRCLIVASSALWACSPSDVSPPVTVRDSAGIRIVKNHRPEQATLPWRVAEAPTVVIGDATADSARQLHHPTSATRLSGGQIVIADRGDAALRFFDDRGTPIRTVGRPGAGPGEFRFLWWIRRLPGDSLAAYDATLFRLSIYDSAGPFQRSQDLPGRPGLFWRQALNLFEGGDALVYGMAPGTMARAEGIRRSERPLFRWPPGATEYDSLGIIWVEEEYAARMGRQFLDIPLPFGRTLDFVPWHDRLLVGWTDTWELKAVGDGGRVQALFRLSHAPLPVTGTDREAALEYLRTRSLKQEVRRTVTRVAPNLPMPNTMPAFGRWAWERVSSDDPERPSLVVDADNNVWVLQYRPPGAPRAWDVLRADGRWLGAVTLPDGLEPFEIGRDYVLGWRKNDLGVIAVELHGLRRP